LEKTFAGYSQDEAPNNDENVRDGESERGFVEVVEATAKLRPD
jgi:hypothetical protein